MRSLADRLIAFLESLGELGLFGWKAIRESFHQPLEFNETTRQLLQVGWRSGPLVIVSGFAFGVVLAMQTGSSMARFGAQAMTPQAVSMGYSATLDHSSMVC